VPDYCRQAREVGGGGMAARRMTDVDGLGKAKAWMEVVVGQTRKGNGKEKQC